MRRALGAVIVVVVLGAPHWTTPLVERFGPRPAQAPPPRPGDPPPPLPSMTVTPAPTPRGVVPASFARDPLHFLSTAPADSLDLLPGIGPVLASRLVDARRDRGSFTSWEDVLAVRGVGPKTVRRLQTLAGHR